MHLAPTVLHCVHASSGQVPRQLPALPLLCSPEYSTQGFHPTLWPTLTTTLDGPEVAIFKQVGTGRRAQSAAAGRAWLPTLHCSQAA